MGTVLPRPKLRLMDQVRKVLHRAFENIKAVRTGRGIRVPMVLTVEEAPRVLARMG